LITNLRFQRDRSLKRTDLHKNHKMVRMRHKNQLGLSISNFWRKSLGLTM